MNAMNCPKCRRPFTSRAALGRHIKDINAGARCHEAGHLRCSGCDEGLRKMAGAMSKVLR